VTDLAARAVVLVVATVGAETDLVAFARTVAGDHGLGTVDQRVAVIIRGTTALSHVIDHATTSALSTCLTILARTCKMMPAVSRRSIGCKLNQRRLPIALTSALIIDARLVARTCVVVAAPNIAHAIVAYLIRDAVIVAVAYRLADAAVTAFIAQTVRIAEETQSFKSRTLR